MKHSIPNGTKLFPVKSDFQKNLFGKSKMLTNRNLYSFHKEIISWKQNASIVELAFEDFTKSFYEKNGEKLNEIILQIKTLDRNFFQHEDGKIKWDVVENKRAPVMNEGLTIEDYNKEFEALMNEPCNVKY